MRIFYVITKFLLFPGAYLRGFWEQVTCRILHLMVESDGYMRLDEACSHVDHSLPEKQFAAYLMSTGPGFMNFNMGMAFFLFGFLNVKVLGITPYDSLPLFIVYVISMYIGVSLLNCLFPLTEDILKYWDIAWGKSKPIKKKGRKVTGGVRKVIALPFTLITRAGAFLEKNCVIFILWVAFLVWQFVF